MMLDKFLRIWKLSQAAVTSSTVNSNCSFRTEMPREMQIGKKEEKCIKMILKCDTVKYRLQSMGVTENVGKIGSFNFSKTPKLCSLLRLKGT